MCPSASQSPAPQRGYHLELKGERSRSLVWRKEVVQTITFSNVRSDIFILPCGEVTDQERILMLASDNVQFLLNIS